MKVHVWWRSLSRAARIDLYVRVSCYSNFAAFPLLIVVGVAPEVGPTATWALTLLTVLYALVCVLLSRAGINNYLGLGPRPTRLIVATIAFTVAGAAAAVLVYPHPGPGEPDGPANVLLLGLVLAFVAALTTAVRPMVALGAGAAGCAVLYALDTAQGATNPAPPTVGLASLMIALLLAYRASLWMLGVIWELDRSRHLQASLAVAEERLRFSRDLHDVVGRTLSVVALKSELAAQLAKRGRDQAVDEMLEVRRIAQDSLTELRAVVGAYRSADLHVELSGARSLLGSAGIECRVIGDGARLPAEVQGVFGWVVREATTNVLRHSEARTCTITVRAVSGADSVAGPAADPAAGPAVSLTVENDGTAARGQPGVEPVRFGNGLTGLAERIARAGGTFSAQVEPSGRFRLTAQLPLVAAPVPAPARFTDSGPQPPRTSRSRATSLPVPVPAPAPTSTPATDPTAITTPEPSRP